jgi:hypothetical protein
MEDLKHLYCAVELCQYSGDNTGALTRQALLQSLLFNDNEGLQARPMVVLPRAKYDGMPMKLRFPNGGHCDEVPKFGNWNLIRQIFRSLEVGTAYHFLCVQDRSVSKIRYIPILLVETFDENDASQASKVLGRLAEHSSADYLNTAVSRNFDFVKWLEED